MMPPSRRAQSFVHTEADQARYRQLGYWPDKTAIDFLEQAVARFPDKTAIRDHRHAYTFRQLAQLVERCACGLLEMGIAPGDVVSFQLPNWCEWVILHYAATRIGAISNPLIPIYRGRELASMLNQARPKLLVVPRTFRGFSYPDMIAGMRERLPDIPHLLVVGREEPDTWEAFMAQAWEELPVRARLDAYRPHPDDPTELIFTSSTTGMPKGVLHTHNTLNGPIVAWADRMGVTHEDVFHMASTFGHQTGFLYGVRLPTMLGATAVYQDVWDPAEFVAWVDAFRISVTNGATPFLYDFIHAPNLAEHDVSSLRIWGCYGAPIPRPVIRQALAAIPGCKVLAGWGQTENALVTVTRPDDPPEKLTTTDGIAFPGMEVRVVRPDGSRCNPGEEGDLQCRGAQLFIGYWRDEALTRSSFTEDGWFITGDRAVMDAVGYIKITGRTKDIIIRGGENIPVAYVEDVLHEHPAIQAAALVAKPDERLQERAVAFVILKPGSATLTLADLQAFLEAKGVAKPYWPEELRVVEAFPRTPSGKIQKYILREWAKQPAAPTE
ncbi:cyclohexanecarboxylate-CoA ligase [Alicyclobacillus cellulosilyticus]|uniref:Cyclohexanecarboxylate-CoA ligase n=1 Tax=Alicyclobacillus cellulosilyticus TaxID=1003997 RepID=A0A917NM48_9BACL|nr:AMP-binding protein [Alicyclobacillus cellulosilyticus]GGJ11143.1 cyclohexanecarboxylate-CoA ligase [Alicyclobacillus cellulosilyticus]